VKPFRNMEHLIVVVLVQIREREKN
jgi:hypothetical protein